ncbi:hypothetical protein Tco_0556538 [Tanacetum coccineum]
MKVERNHINVTFDESPPPTKLSPLVDDDVGEEEAIRKNTKIINTNNEEDESIEVDKVINIKESKKHPLDQYIKELLKKFGLEDSKPTNTPMSTEIKITKDDEADSVDSLNIEHSRQRVHYVTRKIRSSPSNSIQRNMYVIQNIYIPSSIQSCSNPTIILRDNLPPNIKDWELIVRENVICVDTHKSSIDACSAIMLHHLKNSQNFNLHKIEGVKNRVNCPLPYGLLITRLYRFVLARHPKLFRPYRTLQFILHYRMMSSISRKNERKRNESEEAKLDIPYSPSSVESSNQSSPLIGYRSSVDHF